MSAAYPAWWHELEMELFLNADGVTIPDLYWHMLHFWWRCPGELRVHVSRHMLYHRLLKLEKLGTVERVTERRHCYQPIRWRLADKERLKTDAIPF